MQPGQQLELPSNQTLVISEPETAPKDDAKQRGPGSDLKDPNPTRGPANPGNTAPTAVRTEQKFLSMPVTKKSDVQVGEELQPTKTNTFSHDIYKARFENKEWFLKKTTARKALQAYLACSISHDFIPEQPAVKIVKGQSSAFYILLEAVPGFKSVQEQITGCCNWSETWFGCSCCNHPNPKRLILNGQLPFYNELMAHVSLTLNNDARPANIGIGSKNNNVYTALIDQDQSLNEALYYGCDFYIMASPPTPSNLPPGINNAYVLVQEKPGSPPTALYFVDRDPLPLAIENLKFSDGLVQALYPDVTNHHYQDIKNLSAEQLAIISRFTAHNCLRRSAKITAEDIACAPYLHPDGFYPYNHTTNIGATQRYPEKYNSLLSLAMMNNPLFCQGYYARIFCNLLLKPIVNQYVDLRLGNDPHDPFERLTKKLSLSEVRNNFKKTLNKSIDDHEVAALQVQGFREFLLNPATDAIKRAFIANLAHIKRDEDGVTLLSLCPSDFATQIEKRFGDLQDRLKDDSMRIIRAKVTPQSCTAASSEWCRVVWWCSSGFEEDHIEIEEIRPGRPSELKSAPKASTATGTDPLALPGQVTSSDPTPQKPILVLPPHLQAGSPVHAGPTARITIAPPHDPSPAPKLTMP